MINGIDPVGNSGTHIDALIHRLTDGVDVAGSPVEQIVFRPSAAGCAAAERMDDLP